MLPVATRVLAVLMMGLGVLMVIGAITSGGGPLATGVVVGVLFVLLGAGGLWLSLRRLP